MRALSEVENLSLAAILKMEAIYSASLTQMVEGHTALTELSLNKGWISPYDTPIKQLTCSYKESIDAINEK